ncbi:MAG TPA: extracellular solute-binding protein [Rhodanobacteraceae bacterium]|nr:extracellular solute-binding protein [Rhodanobacteraceae bacterium]
MPQASLSRARAAGVHAPVRLLAVALLATAALFAAAPPARAAADALTLYAGQHQQMVRLLVNAFEKESGIRVEVRYGEGPELANQIILEGQRTPADVFFTENSPELTRLQEQHLLAPVDKATLAQIPARYSSDTGEWVGVLARENVLTYDPKLIKASELPKSILELATPKWKGRIGIHLASADIMPLIRTIAVKDSRRAALFWVEGVKLNAKLYQQSSGTVLAVNNGDVPVGISNSYYYYRMRQQLGPKKTVSRVYHFSHGDPGGLVNISGAAVLKYVPHPQLAQKFLAYMVSQQAQTLLAKSAIDFEYPLRPGVPANKELKPFDQLQPPAITVTQLGDNREALQLLQQAGVL